MMLNSKGMLSSICCVFLSMQADARGDEVAGSKVEKISSGANINENAIQQIKKKGSLVVGICGAIERPPFYYRNKKTGAWDGTDILLAESIAKDLGVKLVFADEAKTWDDLVDLLVKQKIDLIVSLLSLTSKRAQIIRYSKPYADLRQLILFNRLALRKAQGKNLNTLNDIFKKDSGFSLCVRSKSSYAAFAKATFPEAELKEFDTFEESIQYVVEGKCAALMHDEVIIFSNLIDNPSNSIYLIPIAIKDKFDSICVGFQEQCSDQFVEYINSFLYLNSRNFNFLSELERKKEGGKNLKKEKEKISQKEDEKEDKKESSKEESKDEKDNKEVGKKDEKKEDKYNKDLKKDKKEEKKEESSKEIKKEEKKEEGGKEGSKDIKKESSRDDTKKENEKRSESNP